MFEGKYKTNVKYLVVPESKEDQQKTLCQRTTEANKKQLQIVQRWKLLRKRIARLLFKM